MGKKSSHWLKSIIAVFLIAIVLFLIVYFFMPELSLKFFGIAFRADARVSTALEDMLVDKFGVDRSSVESFLSTEKGKEVVDMVVEGSKKGADAISDIVNSPEFKGVADNIKDAASSIKQEIQK